MGVVASVTSSNKVFLKSSAVALYAVNMVCSGFSDEGQAFVMEAQGASEDGVRGQMSFRQDGRTGQQKDRSWDEGLRR